jgi:hypothetical protein
MGGEPGRAQWPQVAGRTARADLRTDRAAPEVVPYGPWPDGARAQRLGQNL